MRVWLHLAAHWVICAWAAPALAQQSRVAVLMLAVDDQDAETADGLTEVLIGAVAARVTGVSIIGKEEFQAQLNQGEARSLECVSTPACVGRVGVQLNVDEVIAGTLSRRESRWVFSLSRIRIATGDVAGRAFREVDGDLGALASTVTDALRELYEAPASRLRVAASVEGAEVRVDGQVVGEYAGTALAVERLAAGTHTVEVIASGHRPWRREVALDPGADMLLEAGLVPIVDPVLVSVGSGVSPVLWVGLGLAVAGGGTAAAFGVLSQRELAQGGTRADAVDFVDDRQREALIANIAFGALGVGGITALIGLLVSDFGGADVQPTVSWSPHEVAVGVRGAL